MYEGFYVKGVKDGFGTLKFNNRTYEGEFSANKLHGIGTYTDSDGHIYTGQFIQNCKQGIGKLFKNGTEFGIWQGTRIGITEFEEDENDVYKKISYDEFI